MEPRSRDTLRPDAVSHKDFSALHQNMGGRGESASEPHLSQIPDEPVYIMPEGCVNAERTCLPSGCQ